MEQRNQDQHHEGIVEDPSALSEKIRYGAPDGPRPKRKERYDGHSPLDYPGHEAVARYLAAPHSIREFKSDEDLALYFRVTRMTIYRWKQDVDVIQRANWLSMQNKIAGDLIARREWPRIMEKAVQKAKNGDVQAMKFCAARAWPEDDQREQSRLSTMTLAELIAADSAEDENDEAPSWVLEQIKKSKAVEHEAAEENRALEESKNPPE